MSSRKQTHKKRTSKKDRFDTIPTPAITSGTTSTNAPSSYEDIIDLLSVSPTASDPHTVSWKDQLNDYVILFLKYLFLVAILTLNFLGLSVSLNCNADQELFTRVVSAIFAFFFGFVYLIINYYTYKVLSQGKMCKMNREKLFPFKV
jgi:hypothetical protein